MKDINFLSEEKKPLSVPKKEEPKTENTDSRIKISAKLVGIIISGVVFVAISILAPRLYALGLESKVSSLEEELKSPKYLQIQTLNTQIAEVQGKIDLKNEIIKSINGKAIPVLDILNYVQRSAPVGVVIESIGYSQGAVTIACTSKSEVLAAEYMANLSRIEAFKGLTDNMGFNYTKPGSDYSFNITLPLN